MKTAHKQSDHNNLSDQRRTLGLGFHRAPVTLTEVFHLVSVAHEVVGQVMVLCEKNQDSKTEVWVEKKVLQNWS